MVLPSVPTRDFREPWGLVVNEAFNQGVPVIATDAVGAVAGGLVRHERTGLVVPAGDAGRARRGAAADARRSGAAGAARRRRARGGQGLHARRLGGRRVERACRRGSEPLLAWKSMVRLLTLSGLILLLAAPTASAGVREKILRECQEGRITGDYTPAQLRDARKNIPTDIDEYSDCRDVLARAALTGRAGGGGAAAAVAGPRRPAVCSPAAAAATAVLTPDKAEQTDARQGAQQAPQPIVVDGERIVPGASGLAADAARHGLPTTLLTALVLLGLCAHRRCRARPCVDVSSLAGSLSRRPRGRGPAASARERGHGAHARRRRRARRDRLHRRRRLPARAHDLDRGRADAARRGARRGGAALARRAGDVCTAALMLLGFAALAVFTALSIVWSLSPADSWLEANRTFAYLAVLAGALALVRLAPQRWAAVLHGVALGCVLVCVWALTTKVFPGALAADETYARLREPFGYWNSVGLMAALGVPPLLWLAARRSGPARRANALAWPALGLLFTCLMLSYSRGALLALLIGLALLVRRRAAAPARRAAAARRGRRVGARGRLGVRARRAVGRADPAGRADGRRPRPRRAARADGRGCCSPPGSPSAS